MARTGDRIKAQWKRWGIIDDAGRVRSGKTVYVRYYRITIDETEEASVSILSNGFIKDVWSIVSLIETVFPGSYFTISPSGEQHTYATYGQVEAYKKELEW